MRILFQGDSITDGNRYKDEEHRWDLNHQIGHSYAFIVSGLLGLEYARMNMEFVNRGISGNTSRDLLRRWQQDATEINPDILSVLVGINDCCSEGENHVEPCEYEKNLSRMLEQSFERNTRLRVFLLEPFFLPTKGVYERDSDLWRERLSEYSGVCRKIALADSRIHFIPLQNVFDAACKQRECAYWIWDGVHPTESGHALIAREWIKAFEKDFAEILRNK